VKNMEDMDLSLLDELIARCEAKMGSKFKKKQPEAAPVEEPEEGIEEEAPEAELVEESSEPKDEMSEEDRELLEEMYRKIKG
jgi:hypothetical protein